MKISDQAQVIIEMLQTWAQPKGGVAVVVPNLAAMWETAYKASEKPRLLLCYAGETVRGDFSVATPLHRVDRSWQLAITRGRGFLADRGQSLTQGNQNAEPFYDTVETVRDMVRALNAVSEEEYGHADYKEIRPMQTGEVILDGYIVEFTTANDLPAIQQTQTG